MRFSATVINGQITGRLTDAKQKRPREEALRAWLKKLLELTHPGFYEVRSQATGHELGEMMAQLKWIRVVRSEAREPGSTPSLPSTSELHIHTVPLFPRETELRVSSKAGRDVFSFDAVSPVEGLSGVTFEFDGDSLKCTPLSRRFGDLLFSTLSELERRGNYWVADPAKNLLVGAMSADALGLADPFRGCGAQTLRLNPVRTDAGGCVLQATAPIPAGLSGLHIGEHLEGLVGANWWLEGGSKQPLLLARDGTLDLGHGLAVDEVPEHVNLELVLELVLEDTVRNLRGSSLKLSVATTLADGTLVARGEPETAPGPSPACERLRFETRTPPPARLTVTLASARNKVVVEGARVAQQGTVEYRVPYLGRTLRRAFPVPSLIAMTCAGQPEMIGEYVRTTDTLTGRWQPKQDDRGLDRMTFAPDIRGLREVVLEYPSATRFGETIWKPFSFSSPPPSAIVRARLTLSSGRHSRTLCLPVSLAEAGQVHLSDLSNVKGTYWAGEHPGLELDVPPSAERTGLCVTTWSPFATSHLETEEADGRLRATLSRPQLDRMAAGKARLWVGTRRQRFQHTGWCHSLWPPPPPWIPCPTAGHAYVVPQAQSLFVDFRGLTSDAHLESVRSDYYQEGCLFLRLEAPWNISGGDDMGADGGALAPLAGAVFTPSGGKRAHYWIQDLRRGPGLLHLVVSQSGAGDVLEIARTGPDDLDPGDEEMRRLQVDGPGAWLDNIGWEGLLPDQPCRVVWRGMVVELAPPPRPALRFAGWTWTRHVGAEWATPPPCRVFGFVDEFAHPCAKTWRAELKLENRSFVPNWEAADEVPAQVRDAVEEIGRTQVWNLPRGAVFVEEDGVQYEIRFALEGSERTVSVRVADGEHAREGVPPDIRVWTRPPELKAGQTVRRQ